MLRAVALCRRRGTLLRAIGRAAQSSHPAAPQPFASHPSRDDVSSRFAYGPAEAVDAAGHDHDAARGHYTPDGMPHGYDRRRLMSERLWMAESSLMKAVGVFAEDRRSFRLALLGTAGGVAVLLWMFWPLLKSMFVSQVR